MLTKVDWAVFTWIYVTFPKSFVGTPFTWENGKVTMKVNRMYNYITWVLHLLSLTYKYKQLFPLIQTRDFNGLALHGIGLLAFTANIINKLNILLNCAEMVRLINEVLRINSSWG